jgi:flagellar M-ring protein FliF
MAVASQEFVLERLKGFNQLSSSRKLGLMLGLSALIALLIGAWLWVQTPDYRVLYSNLSDRDGGAIIASLQQMNVPYKIAEGGGAIMVPAGQVYEVRLRLASQGLPKGSVVGFELMENQKLGTSQFLEQVNYQRALEGELTRSIQSLSAVQSARVHLAIPRASVFVREQQKPGASVLITLYPGRVLDGAQVSGIVHLISSSVPEMPLKNVTVVDQNGNLLTPSTDGLTRAGLEPGQLDYLGQVEQSYVKRIEDILAPITGPDNIRAQVTADLDFSQAEQTAETFKPNGTPAEAAIRSQQSSETTGGGQPPSGVPGALSNQPPGAASAPITAPSVVAGGTAAGSGGSSHKESTVNYEVDKTVKHVKLPVGTVKRLSVAVVVNYRKTTDKNGKTVAKPWSQQEMAQINNLVKEAMGFTPARGDTLNVVNASFTPATEEAPLPAWKEPATVALVKDVLRNLLIVGVVFFLIFGVLRPLLRDISGVAQKAGDDPPEGAEGGDDPPAPATPSSQLGYEESLKAAKDLAKQEPRIVANVVRDWMGSGGE